MVLIYLHRVDIAASRTITIAKSLPRWIATLRIVRPKDLLRGARRLAPHRSFRRGPARRRVEPRSPSRRTCRIDMRRADYLRLVALWIGAVAMLLVVVLWVRWS